MSSNRTEFQTTLKININVLNPCLYMSELLHCNFHFFILLCIGRLSVCVGSNLNGACSSLRTRLLYLTPITSDRLKAASERTEKSLFYTHLGNAFVICRTNLFLNENQSKRHMLNPAEDYCTHNLTFTRESFVRNTVLQFYILSLF